MSPVIKSGGFAVAVCCCLLFAARQAGAEVVSLAPTDDAYLDSAQPSGTWDTAVLNQFGYYGNYQRPLLKFDLSVIPDNAAIHGATLTLQLVGVYGGDLHASSLWRLPDDNWVEESVSWNTYNQDAGVVVGALPPVLHVQSRIFVVRVDDWDYAADLVDNAVTFQTRWHNTVGFSEGDGWYKANDYSSKEGSAAPVLWIDYSVNAVGGDANGDACVSGADYTIWADHWNQSPASVAEGDFDDNDHVAAADYAIWFANYGQGRSPSPGGLVPEPSSIELLACGLLLASVVWCARRATCK